MIIFICTLYWLWSWTLSKPESVSWPGLGQLELPHQTHNRTQPLGPPLFTMGAKEEEEEEEEGGRRRRDEEEV